MTDDRFFEREQLDENDPFYSAKRKLSRAKSHIVDFEVAIRSYFLGKTEIGEIVFEPDEADPTIYLHKFRFTKRLPEKAEDTAADAILNMRAALDSASFASAALGGHPDPKSAKFPFGNSSADVENDIRRGCNDIPDEIKTVFRAFTPYKGGNDALWSLNNLCNLHKHKLIVPMAVESVEDRAVGFVMSGEGSLFAPEWSNEKNEVIFGESPAGEDLNYKAKLSFFVAFNEIDILRGIAALDALNSMADEVNDAIVAIEAECRRIGLVA
jgi:hypothetical protein